MGPDIGAKLGEHLHGAELEIESGKLLAARRYVAIDANEELPSFLPEADVLALRWAAAALRLGRSIGPRGKCGSLPLEPGLRLRAEVVASNGSHPFFAFTDPGYVHAAPPRRRVPTDEERAATQLELAAAKLALEAASKQRDAETSQGQRGLTPEVEAALIRAKKAECAASWKPWTGSETRFGEEASPPADASQREHGEPFSESLAMAARLKANQAKLGQARAALAAQKGTR